MRKKRGDLSLNLAGMQYGLSRKVNIPGDPSIDYLCVGCGSRIGNDLLTSLLSRQRTNKHTEKEINSTIEHTFGSLEKIAKNPNMFLLAIHELKIGSTQKANSYYDAYLKENIDDAASWLGKAICEFRNIQMSAEGNDSSVLSHTVVTGALKTSNLCFVRANEIKTESQADFTKVYLTYFCLLIDSLALSLMSGLNGAISRKALAENRKSQAEHSKSEAESNKSLAEHRRSKAESRKSEAVSKLSSAQSAGTFKALAGTAMIGSAIAGDSKHKARDFLVGEALLQSANQKSQQAIYKVNAQINEASECIYKETLQSNLLTNQITNKGIEITRAINDTLVENKIK